MKSDELLALADERSIAWEGKAREALRRAGWIVKAAIDANEECREIADAANAALRESREREARLREALRRFALVENRDNFTTRCRICHELWRWTSVEAHAPGCLVALAATEGET